MPGVEGAPVPDTVSSGASGLPDDAQVPLTVARVQDAIRASTPAGDAVRGDDTLSQLTAERHVRLAEQRAAEEAKDHLRVSQRAEQLQAEEQRRQAEVGCMCKYGDMHLLTFTARQR